MKPKPVRLHWVDFVKAINITYVVWLHVHHGLINSGLYEESSLAYYCRRSYGSFVMPSFFFLSGMFIMSSASKPFLEFLKEKWQGIVYSYFVWATIHSVIRSSMGNWTNREQAFSDIWLLIIVPPDHFWFMYVIFLAMLFVALCIRIHIKPSGIFALSMLLYSTAFFPEISIGPWGVIHLLRISLPYFALGALIGRRGPILWLNGAKWQQLVPIILVCFSIVLWAVKLGGRDSLWAEPIMAVFGFCGSFSLAILLARSGRFKWFEFIGHHSMEIYVAHVIGLAGTRIVLMNVLGIESLYIHFLLGTMGGMFFPVFLGWFANRLGFPYLFTLKKARPTPLKSTVQPES